MDMDTQYSDSNSCNNEDDNLSSTQNGYNHDDDKVKTCPVSKIGGSNLRSDYRQFHVLDEVENESDSKDSDGTDSDVPDEEVERMLEEALVNRKRTAEQADLSMHLSI